MGWGEWSEPQHKPERIDIFDAPRSLSDLGVHREGKRDRDQNLCKFEANSGLFNEDLREFWPISAFPQQNHPKSDRLLGYFELWWMRTALLPYKIYKKRVRIKTTFSFFSALLCAEKKEGKFMNYRFPDVHGEKTRPADLSALFPDERLLRPEF